MEIKKIIIIGVGLIGGSIGKTVLEKKPAIKVVGICRKQSSLDKALKERSITTGFVNNYEEALKSADLIIIATPVETIKKVLEMVAEVIMDKNVLVTDVGSTKEEIVKFAGKFKDHFTFIGSHPLAGSEKTGVESSSSDLLQDSVCVITPEDVNDKSVQVETLETFWRSLGIKVCFYSPEEHDRIIAFSSHLPHFIAYTLAGTLKEGLAKEMFSTGFKDTTRIAASDAGLWTDIFMTNRDNLLKSLESFKTILGDAEKTIRKNEHESLKKKLEEFKKKRSEYF